MAEPFERRLSIDNPTAQALAATILDACRSSKGIPGDVSLYFYRPSGILGITVYFFRPSKTAPTHLKAYSMLTIMVETTNPRLGFDVADLLEPELGNECDMDAMTCDVPLPPSYNP